MRDITWLLIKSWHVLDEGDQRTLCGLVAEGRQVVRAKLQDGKSCENCLRILARQVDR